MKQGTMTLFPQVLLVSAAAVQVLAAQTPRMGWVVLVSTPSIQVDVDSTRIHVERNGIYRVQLRYTYLSDSLRPHLGRLGGGPLPPAVAATSEADVDCSASLWRWRRIEYYDSLAKPITSEKNHDGWRTVQPGEPLFRNLRPLCDYLVLVGTPAQRN